MKFYYFSFFTVLILFTACATKPVEINTPQYEKAKNVLADDSFSAVGESANLETAKSRAIENLRLKIKNGLEENLRTNDFYINLVNNAYSRFFQYEGLKEDTKRFIIFSKIINENNRFLVEVKLQKEDYKKALKEKISESLKLDFLLKCGANLGLVEFNAIYNILRELEVNFEILKMLGVNLEKDENYQKLSKIYNANAPLPSMNMILNYSQMPLDRQYLIQYTMFDIAKDFFTVTNVKASYSIILTTLVFNNSYNFIITLNNCLNEILWQFNFKLGMKFTASEVKDIIGWNLMEYIKSGTTKITKNVDKLLQIQGGENEAK